MKQLSLILTLLTALIVATHTYAHTGLESSVPGNNAMMTESLEKLELHFSSEVNLTQLELVDKVTGESIPLSFTPTTTASVHFDQPLPALKITTYQVNWTAMGADGHKMEGNFSFMMHPGTMTHSGSDQMHGESGHSGH